MLYTVSSRKVILYSMVVSLQNVNYIFVQLKSAKCDIRYDVKIL